MTLKEEKKLNYTIIKVTHAKVSNFPMFIK